MYSSVYSRYKPQLSLNNKGADSFVSTTNPILDLFTYTRKTLLRDLESFKQLIASITQAKNFNSELFIKLLKFQRLIKKGNGIKHIYYLCMILIKMEVPSLYEKLLEWSYEYPKDILFLHKVNSMFISVNTNNTNTYSPNPSPNSSPSPNINPNSIKLDFNYLSFNNPRSYKMNIFNYKMVHANIIFDNNYIVSEEIKIYGDLVFSNFIIILSGHNNYNPMLIKYLSYETGHWIIETELIWKYIEKLASTDDVFNNLVLSEELISDFATKLRILLKNNKKNDKYFTNKNKRLIKKLFNTHINLTDNLYKGIHTDGTLFGSNPDRNIEIDMIYQVIKKTPAKSFDIITKYIKSKSNSNSNSNSENAKSSNPKHILLKEGYNKYLEKLEKKEVTVKTTGLDLTSKCMEFYNSPLSLDSQLEYQLEQQLIELKSYILPSFNEEFTFKDFSSQITLVIDISGSMDGIPLETGLLYFILMVKLFGIKNLYYFASDAYKKELTQEDIDGTFCSLIKKVYCSPEGSTNLKSIFDLLENEKASNKTVIIITDGDCDPGYDNTTSPFHKVTCALTYKSMSTNNYVVVNVKEDKMNFPYLGIDPKVCYVTGNNTKTINGLIKSMIVAKRDSISITPELILQYSLDLVELDVPEVSPTFTMVLTEEQIINLHKVFIKNLPPINKNTNEFDNQYVNVNVNEDENEDEDEDEDENEDNSNNTFRDTW